MLRLTDRVGARTDRLRLECLERPATAHLVRHNALDVRLQIHEVHQCEFLRLLRIEAGKLEIAVVRARAVRAAIFTLSHLRDRGTAAVLWCKRKRLCRAAVKAEEDLVRTGLYNQHTA